MAEAAGIVNADGPANDAAFQEILVAMSHDVQEVAWAVRELVYDVLPETVEVVWVRQRSVGWGTGPKKFTEQFAYLLPFKKHVTLGFYRGGELSDPFGLLPDAGEKKVGGKLSMRSLKLRSLDDVRQPGLRTLIRASTEHGIPPP